MRFGVSYVPTGVLASAKLPRGELGRKFSTRGGTLARSPCQAHREDVFVAALRYAHSFDHSEVKRDRQV